MEKLKKKIKQTLFIFFKCIVAGIVALAILSGVCFLVNYSGARVHNESGATDFKWGENQYRATALEGFSWFFMDNHGFNNIENYSKNPEILIMGSSHMEGANVNPEKTTASLLLKGTSYSVYNIATSGHTIYNCVNNMDNAVKEYSPSKYLIVETVSAELSVAEMQKVIDGKFKPFESYDSGVLYALQKYIPAVKAMYKQIGFWRDADKTLSENPSTQLEEENYEEVLEAFLLKAKNSADKSGAQLIIFYHPEIKIDEKANAYTEVSDRNKLLAFEDVCNKLGILYVDMTDTFTELYNNDHILPYGFYNTGVGSAHLNEHGHKAIAEEIYNLISEDK